MQINVRIHKIFTDRGKLKAVASVNLDDSFNIHNIRLIDGAKGMFLSMPDVKRRDGKFRDLCYPTNTNFRTSLTEAVVTAYKANLQPTT